MRSVEGRESPPSAAQRHTLVPRIEHDRDNIGGAERFVLNWRAASRTIRQAWLPAIWSLGATTRLRSEWIESRIVAGAFEADDLVEAELARIVEEVESERTSLTAATAIRMATRRVAEELDVADNLFEPVMAVGGDTVIDDWTGYTEDGEGEPHALAVGWRSRARSAWWWLGMTDVRDVPYLLSEPGGLAMILAYDAMRCHRLFAPVVAACMATGVQIRWFDYMRFAKGSALAGGDVGALQPVNSVEVARSKRRAGAMRFFLALTLTRPNVESLVFMRLETDEPAVLFTADSRLAFGQRSPTRDFPRPPGGLLPTRRRPLVTACHHASANNEHGYGVLSRWQTAAPSLLYVRNGGYGLHGIASSFLAAERQCVRCRGDRRPARLVRIEAPGGAWLEPSPPLAMFLPVRTIWEPCAQVAAVMQRHDECRARATGMIFQRDLL